MAADTKTSPLAVPSVLYVAPRAKGGDGFVVRRGSAVGWFAPRGIRQWENEVSFVKRGALTEQVRKDLGVTMPEEQIPAAKSPYAAKAAAASPLVGVASSLKDKLTEKGVRVHTVGCDRISGGFYYFAEGGSGAKVSVQGDLIEMLTPSLEAGTSNDDLEVLLDGIIDRILQDFSSGELTEADVELAAALPRAAADGTGLSGVDVDAFERDAAKLAGAADKFMNAARDLASKLADADKRTDEKVSVPLFGEAKRHALVALEIEVGGERRKLAARHEWIVTGEPKLDAAPAKAEAKPKEATPKPAAAKEAAPKAATPKPAPTKEAPKAETKPKSEPKPEPKKAEDKPKAEEKKVEAKAEPKAEEKKAEAKQEEKKPEPKAEKAPEEKKAEEKKAEAKAEEKKDEKKKSETAPKAEDRIAAKAAEKKDDKKPAEKKAAAKDRDPDEVTAKTRARTSDKDDAVVPKSSGPSPVVWFIAAAVVAAIVWAAFFRH